MDYLRKELNKFLPLALLFGAIGGVLLIVVGNVFEPNKLSLLVSYSTIISISVYSLNRMRYKKEITGSMLYGFLVYSFMTFIAYIYLLMNTFPNFTTSLFEQIGFSVLIFFGTFAISGIIVYLFQKRLIS